MQIPSYRLQIWLTVFMLCFGMMSGVSAQTNEGVDPQRFAINRIGVIDLGKVLREAKATDKVRVLLDEKRTEFQQDFSAKEAILLAKEKELKSKQNIITKTAYEDEVRNFQAEVTEVQREIQQKRQSIDNAFQQAQDTLRELATTITADMAKELSLALVLNRDQVLIFRNQLDLTEMVLDRLNERTKNARLEINEQPPALEGN